MSVKVSSWVWHEAPQSISGNDLIVLLALADIANDSGDCVFVKSKEDATQEALANKSRVSKRTFQRCIDRLVELGVVAVVRGAQHLPNEYRVLIQGGQNDVSGVSRGVTSDIQSGQSELPDMPTVSPHRDVKRKNVSKREATSIPADFRVTDAMREWASVNAPAVNLDRETDSFVDYWREGNGKGKQHKSWEQTWRTWFRNAQTRAERFGWRADDAAEVVELENVTQIRLARELAEQKARWFAERGTTEAEYEANRDNPVYLASLEVRRRG